MFLMMSIYYLTNGVTRKTDEVLFTVFLACAVSCKTHILVVIPLLYLYLYWKKGLKEVTASLCGLILIVAIIIYPYWCEGFIRLVLFNKEQSVLTKNFFDYGIVKVYIPILMITLLYLKIIQLGKINRDFLFCMSGILWSAIIKVES